LPGSYEQAILRSNPIGYWRFSGVDQSKCINEVSLEYDIAEHIGSMAFDVPGPDLGEGRPNNALKTGRPLDNDMIIDEKRSRGLHGEGFSMLFWLRFENYGGQSIIKYVSLEGQDNRFVRSLLLEPTGELTFNMFYGPVVYSGEAFNKTFFSIKSKRTIQTGQWVHVAVSKTRVHATLYIDGQIEGEADFGDNKNDTVSSWYLCTRINQTDYPTIDGAIDELAVYDRALSSDEIRRLRSSALLRR